MSRSSICPVVVRCVRFQCHEAFGTVQWSCPLGTGLHAIKWAACWPSVLADCVAALYPAIRLLVRLTLSSRSHSLSKHGIHGEKELAELPNKAKQWQPPFGRIKVLEQELGVMNLSVSGESGLQAPGFAHRDNRIAAIVQKDHERGMNIFQVIHWRYGG